MNPRMKQTAVKASKTSGKGPTPAELLARMPRRPLTPEQQMTAIEKVQQQATQRVKLGQQLFEAADARLKQHQEVLKEIQDQQHVLREQVQDDVAKSLQSYDQWMGKIDESFTKAIKQVNERLDQLELRVDASRGELEVMIEKATALMGQTQGLMAEAFEGSPQSHAGPASTQVTSDISKHAEPLDTVFDVTPQAGEEGLDEFTDLQNPYPVSTQTGSAEVADDVVADDVVAEMQRSVPADPHCDIDTLGVPKIKIDMDELDAGALAYEPAPEVFEVQIVSPDEASEAQAEIQQDKALGLPAPGNDENDEEEDVFGEVLRQLRKRAADDGFAAA